MTCGGVSGRAGVVADVEIIADLSDLLRAARTAGPKASAAVKAGLSGETAKIIERAATYAQRASGNMAAHTKVRITASAVTITWTEPYSAVQAWATSYQRGGPRPGTVTMSSPSNFPVRARDELTPVIADEMVEAVAASMRSAGFDMQVLG
jgi:hypothetical protein